MDTKLFKNGSQWFFMEREYSGLLAFVLFPTVYWETRQKGLSVKTTRITLAFARLRLHFHVGCRLEPPVLGENFLSPAFVNWASSWAKQPLSQKDMQRWVLQNPQWRYIVAWGGAHLHYSKILLVREYLLHLNHSQSSAGKSSSLDDDEIDLDISWMDAPVSEFAPVSELPGSSIHQAPTPK